MTSPVRFAAQFDSESRLNRETGLLAGVSIITEGLAKGHGQLIDRTTIEQVKACLEKFKGGVKVKSDHWTGVGQIIAYVHSFRLDASGPHAKVRGDLQLYKSRPDFTFYCDLFETIADNIGLSIFFSGIPEEDKETGVSRARCTEIYSVDLVTEPAANDGGLFDMRGAAAMKALTAALTPEALETQLTGLDAAARCTSLAAAFVALSCGCKAEREKLTGERDSATTQLATTTGERDNARTPLSTMTTERDTALAKVTKLEGEARSAEQRALEIAAAAGVLPVPKSSEHTNPQDGGDAALWEKYSAAAPNEQAQMRETLGAKLDAAALAFDRRKAA